MNTVKVFAEGVIDQISNYLPEEFQNMEFTVIENTKNNGVILTGLNVHIPGENISPVLYMNDFYDAVKEGLPLDEIMGRIASCIEECRSSNIMSMNLGMDDIAMLQERVTPMLINAKANREILQSMPFIQMEDLAMIFKIDMFTDGYENRATLKVKNDMIERWGITKEDLYKKAISNIQKHEPPVLFPMSDVVYEQATKIERETNLLKDDYLYPIFEDQALFVLTNKSRLHGTSALLCPGVLDKISDFMPEGFYILPSSIHETIIISKDCGMSPKHLGQMVREINHGVVDREDVLSDRIYEYDKDLGKFKQVPESIQKSREVVR